MNMKRIIFSVVLPSILLTACSQNQVEWQYTSSEDSQAQSAYVESAAKTSPGMPGVSSGVSSAGTSQVGGTSVASSSPLPASAKTAPVPAGETVVTMSGALSKTVPAALSQIRFFGRDYLNGNAVYFDWSASGFKFNFTGTGADATFEGIVGTPYLSVTVDDGQRQVIVVNQQNGYSLASGLKAGKHKVTVEKMDDNRSSSLGLVQIRILGGELSAPPQQPARKIELLGDSITTGVGCYPEAGQIATPDKMDGTVTWGALAAKAFGADLHVEAVGGIGVVRGGDAISLYAKNNNAEFLPVFNMLTAFHSSTAWKFSVWQPDVVAINLGTNDAFVGVAKSDFLTGAISLIQSVRSRYPKAKIIWAYGLMENSMASSVAQAVETVNRQGDKNVYCVTLPLRESADGSGIGGHPNTISHKKAAAVFENAVEKIMGWRL